MQLQIKGLQNQELNQIRNKMENEIWKDIPGYEGYYQVSNYSRIKSLARKVIRGTNYLNLKEKILNPTKNTSGYFQIRLSKDGTEKIFQIHRLCLISFKGIDLYRNEVNHIDGNCTNNKLENLEWVNRMENNCHHANRKKSSSRYTGVYFHKLSQKWVSGIKINRKEIYLGLHELEEDAYKARLKYINENNIVNKYL